MASDFDSGTHRCANTAFDAISRPDLIDLISTDYDHPPTAPASQTLIVCAAPRTGSTELGRLLTAAGLGVPHEYFNPQWAQILAERWSVGPSPLEPQHIGAYIEALRSRRARGGLFASKLQFWQFTASLRNMHGEALFRDARVIYLFRPDIVAQLASFRRARATGQWDFSGRVSSNATAEDFEQVMGALDLLIAEDAGFRRLFALLEIRPLFLTLDDINKRPREVVDTIARLVNLAVDHAKLSQMLAASAPYTRHDAAPGSAEYSQALKRCVFPHP
jgi:LPS sulfotransferase NodH